MRGCLVPLARYAFGLCVVAALASCGPRAGLDPAATGSVGQGRRMANGMTSNDLLYVSDDIDVYVYSYPGARLVDTLTNLYAPWGLCSDAAGDVFVSENTGNGEVVEFAHAGTEPIATFADPNVPFGCAVSPATGDLAVTTYAGQSPRTSGSIAIFYAAVIGSAPPRVYHAPHLFFYFFCAYDDSGNLFVAGQTARLEPAVDELSKGKRSFTELMLQGLPKDFHLPGGLSWDGRYLALGDPDHNRIYRLKISGSTARLFGSVKLAEGDQVEEFSIVAFADKSRRGRRLIGPNSLSESVMFWPYPSGGLPTKTIMNIPYLPIGTALSIGAKTK
jgi:hypothetical protein